MEFLDIVDENDEIVYYEDKEGLKKYITEIVCNEILFLGSKGQ